MGKKKSKQRKTQPNNNNHIKNDRCKKKKRGRSGGSSSRDTVYLPEYEGYGWMDYDETLTGKKLGFYDDISDEEGEIVPIQSNVSTSLWKNIDTYRRAPLAASILPFVILTLLMLPPSTFPLAVTLKPVPTISKVLE